MPIYWRALQKIPAAQLVCQRIFWSCLTLALLLAGLGKLKGVAALLRNGKKVAALALCSLLLCLNWYLYIHLVNAGQLLETGFGLFLTPLCAALLAVVVLRRRLDLAQCLALVLGLAGIICHPKISGALPWAAVGLAVCGALYGILRAVMQVEILPGLLLEMLLALPFAGAALIYFQLDGTLIFSAGNMANGLLMSTSGLVTVIPLLLLAFATPRLKMHLLGRAQFIAPCMAIAIGISLVGEQFHIAHFISFTLVCCALAVYGVNEIRREYPAPRSAG
jgi:chloramphenicol-sensitive protein RarD